MADGSYGTQTRLWGWDRSSNVLYIDQPVQVGLSYDTATNSSLDLMQGLFTTPPTASGGSGPAFTYLNGTFSSQDGSATTNTSQIAAQAVWHFLQTFLPTFPEYNPGVQPNDSTTYPSGVNLFTESYGGEYGPIFADYFEAQNDLLHAGKLPVQTTLEIKLASLGIMNGLVDWRIQVPYYAKFASNNTYGIKAIDSTTATNALAALQVPGGCIDQIDQCRDLMDAQDALGEGDIDVVNMRCASAFKSCAQAQNLLSASSRNVYDIRQNDPSPFPSSAYVEYLNTAQVQEAIGTSINFTQNTAAVATSFYSTGDPIRGTQLPDLGRLLARGIRVALLYGDADFICNWQGGEAISLALATMLPAYSIPFPAAGYAEIVVNNTYIGGEVRQFGNLSFARIYDSGHLIPAYQPETAFTVFTRVVQGTALSTGEDVNLTTYATNGTQFSTHTNKAGKSLEPVCWVRSILTTCTPDQRTQILAGQGAVMNGVWLENESQYKPPSSSVVAGSPGKPMPNSTVSVAAGKTTTAATGVYTATGTPKVGFAVPVGRVNWGMLGVMIFSWSLCVWI